MLRAALLELVDALEAGTEALTQTAEGQPSLAARMRMHGKADGYSEAASDLHSILEEYKEGDKE